MANLLIVDDDQNTLASLARAFRLAGHDATVCDNAARALDMVMPGNDARNAGNALPRKERFGSSLDGKPLNR